MRRSFNPYTGRLATVVAGAGSGSGINPTLQNDTYLYDALGNLTYRAQLGTSGLLQENFGYDELNRLHTSALGSDSKTFDYDALGNLSSKTDVGRYTYPSGGAGTHGPHALSDITGTVAGLTNPHFDYDANGNLSKGLGRAYGWTAADQPDHIDKLSNDQAVQRTQFTYGPDHERLTETTAPMSNGTPGAATDTVVHAGAIEKEVDVANNVTIIRTSLGGVGYVEERITGTSVSATAEATRNGRLFLKDHLGSVIGIVDEAGNALQRLSYDAWGRRRNLDGSDDSWASLGTIKNTQDRSGYTGHEQLDQLGLVDMNARMYDPITGRHISADPTVPDATNGQAFNRYSYVLNNALAFTDPTGLRPDVFFFTTLSNPFYSDSAEVNDSLKAARWWSALMRGKSDPTFWDDLEDRSSLDDLRAKTDEVVARWQEEVLEEQSDPAAIMAQVIAGMIELAATRKPSLAVDGGDVQVAGSDKYPGPGMNFRWTQTSQGAGFEPEATISESIYTSRLTGELGDEGVNVRKGPTSAAKGLAGVPGRVGSRINLSNEGMEHVIARHLSGKANASQFSLSEAELRSVLSSRAAVGSPVVRSVESADGIRYVREFDAGRVIGTDKFNGNQATSVMTIMTDRFGNLVSTFPGLLK